MVDSGYSPPLVVDLGADAPVPVRARSWIAVPLRAHAVVAPRPGQAEEANLLQHAVLGLLRAGVREPSDLGQRLVLRRELVEIVLGDLLSEGWVDDERMLLPAGELALQEPGGSLDYRQLWAFQEPWTGRLLPRFAEHLEAAEVLQRGNGTIKAIIGPVGNPREEEATEISLRSDEYRSLGLEEVGSGDGPGHRAVAIGESVQAMHATNMRSRRENTKRTSVGAANQATARSTCRTPSAHTYSPTPKTVCVTRLFTLACVGLGVFDDIMPSPSEGCRRKNGKTTVAIP